MEEGKKNKGTRHIGPNYDVFVGKLRGLKAKPTQRTKSENKTTKNRKKKTKKHRGTSSKQPEGNLDDNIDSPVMHLTLSNSGQELTTGLGCSLHNLNQLTTQSLNKKPKRLTKGSSVGQSSQQSSQTDLTLTLERLFDEHRSSGGSSKKQHPNLKKESSSKKTEKKQQKEKRKNKPKKPKADRHLEMQCPICYQTVEKENRATVPGCGHHYCKEKIIHTCPQCKRPFDSLKVFRNLDGTIRTASVKENVSMLRRTDWYNRAKAEQVTLMGMDAEAEDLDDWDDDYFSNEIDDAEDYYFSHEAGSARIMIANRKFGKHGFIRSGRVYPQTLQSKSTAEPKETKIPSGQRPDREKAEPKGKKARKRAQKKLEAGHRLL